MEHTVTGCKDCPMFISDNDYKYGWVTDCGHPDFESRGVVVEIDVDGEGNRTTPENCPLNKEPITISKNNMADIVCYGCGKKTKIWAAIDVWTIVNGKNYCFSCSKNNSTV